MISTSNRITILAAIALSAIVDRSSFVVEAGTNKTLAPTPAFNRATPSPTEGPDTPAPNTPFPTEPRPWRPFLRRRLPMPLPFQLDSHSSSGKTGGSDSRKSGKSGGSGSSSTSDSGGSRYGHPTHYKHYDGPYRKLVATEQIDNENGRKHATSNVRWTSNESGRPLLRRRKEEREQ
mmetsp:Transcript_30742/g.74241  ORF Transcript_30742/g.74241 Transcript_30742/m.74241 type:complete len:177 (+) Transcript_30742:141-671(+)